MISIRVPHFFQRRYCDLDLISANRSDVACRNGLLYRPFRRKEALFASNVLIPVSACDLSNCRIMEAIVSYLRIS